MQGAANDLVVQYRGVEFLQHDGSFTKNIGFWLLIGQIRKNCFYLSNVLISNLADKERLQTGNSLRHQGVHGATHLLQAYLQ